MKTFSSFAFSLVEGWGAEVGEGRRGPKLPNGK
jgi:hypothetical protein